MATQELQTSFERPAAGPELFISRQPVVEGEMRVSGYRVAYSTSDGDATYLNTDAFLAKLGQQRDVLAAQINGLINSQFFGPAAAAGVHSSHGAVISPDWE